MKEGKRAEKREEESLGSLQSTTNEIITKVIVIESCTQQVLTLGGSVGSALYIVCYSMHTIACVKAIPGI